MTSIVSTLFSKLFLFTVAYFDVYTNISLTPPPYDNSRGGGLGGLGVRVIPFLTAHCCEVKINDCKIKHFPHPTRNKHTIIAI